MKDINHQFTEDGACSFKTLDIFLVNAVDLARKHSTSVETVIEAKKILEMERRNNILTAAFKFHSSNWSLSIANSFDRIADAIRGKSSRF
jgi:hypothetical protein